MHTKVIIMSTFKVLIPDYIETDDELSDWICDNPQLFEKGR
ncbi:hypothetical protein SAMN05421510_105714 [Nitrosomonas ureae]|uniref:Uncharacterized protein n=1 Tax=Nitrosomonas ureae TaxID=44577 RepID=A0A1H9G8M1_9PROT|nr:hypothetical protein SAMN05421510_105714 [Nitrosomonas ureae]